MGANAFGYPPAVWRLFRETPRAGRLDQSGVLSAAAGTPASRSELRLQVKMRGSRIADARFQAYGCPTTIAVGAWIAERVVGMEWDDLAAVQAAEIRKALEIAEDRTHCALLGEDLIRSLRSQRVPAPVPAAATR